MFMRKSNFSVVLSAIQVLLMNPRSEEIETEPTATRNYQNLEPNAMVNLLGGLSHMAVAFRAGPPAEIDKEISRHA